MTTILSKPLRNRVPDYAASTRPHPGAELTFRPSPGPSLGVENKWLATRYGLEAPYIDSPDGTRRPLIDDTARLIERLLPIARMTGDEPFLAPFLPIDQFESGGKRQRRLYGESGSGESLMDHLVQELTSELDLAARSLPDGEFREHADGTGPRDVTRQWDVVDQASWESFPTSDAPPWSLG